MQKDITFSVAPMMEWTDRHCRYFHRLLNKDIALYTEMVTTGALIHGDAARFLRFHPAEHPVILQLGGSDPDDLAHCAKLAEDYGYDEINLNCGCPSDRVQKGAFGACLMRTPELVAACIEKMQAATSVPVSLKCRIGIDESDDYEFLEQFVTMNEQAGCKTFIIHARKAWLKGLSPKENRDIPPLNYERVYQLKAEHPELNIHINGGITSLEDVKTHTPHINGIMIGREAYQNPWFLREIARSAAPALMNRIEIVSAMMAYAECEMKDYNAKLHDVTRHMLGLFKGMPGGKAWRQHLSNAPKVKENNTAYILDFFKNSDTMILE